MRSVNIYILKLLLLQLLLPQYHQYHDLVVYGYCGFYKSDERYTQIILYDGILPLVSNSGYDNTEEVDKRSWIISFSILAMFAHMHVTWKEFSEYENKCIIH